MMDAQKSDADFCPTLSDAGRKMLAFMREHPAAPIFRNESGNRLLAAEVQALHAFEQDVSVASVGWPRGGHPEWLGGHVQQVFDEVPFFQRLGSPPLRFEDIPTMYRSDLSADIASFVPNSVALDRMINFRTTGTTGNPLLIASHPVVAGRYLAFHKRALHRFGIELRHGAGQVGVVLLGFQKKCFTYVSVTPTMGDSGLAKINLHLNDWRQPQDREAYLEALQAEVIAGDPISFVELLRMQVQIRPRALFSVGMMLSPGLREALEHRFSCPVLDFYSMNETGPIGVFDAQAGGHVLLQPRLYVEILDEQGHAVPEGAPGEITLTGGFNFCLPLMRYRTGDHAALHWLADGPALVNLQGRKPVCFRCANGLWVNNIDVTHALAPLPLSQYALHQEANGSFILRIAANDMARAAPASDLLRVLFGDAPLKIETIAVEGKQLQYTSDLEVQTRW